MAWGQRTLLRVAGKSSKIDRINCRRNINDLKQFVSMVVKDFVFEQNIALNRQRLFNKIDPYFSNVRKNGGL